MKKGISIAVCFLILLGCVLPAQASGGVPQEVMEATKSVVRILSEYKKDAATGSGFVIKNDGEEVLIATNDHVVAGDPQRISVWVGEDRQVDAEIVFTTSAKDICVLRIAEAVDMEPLTLSEEEAQHGAAIYAVGYPGAGDVLSDTLAHTSDSVTITDGIISAIRTFTIEEGAAPVKLLQVNAAINPGNSGGPLFNTKGEVIGINTYKVNVDSQGVFGSVSVIELRKLLEEYGIVLVEEVPETEPQPTEETVIVEEPEPVPVKGMAIGGMMIALLLVVLVVLTANKRKKISLRAYMEQFPDGLGGREAVSMLLPAAIELRNLHNDGKLHLQLSPDTILVSSKGAVLKAPGKRETDRLCPGFAAPEIYRGAGYGVASDLYSFAAIVLFAATGKIPPNSLQQDVLKAELAALEEAEPEFAAVLRNAMAFQPQDRTQSMQELIYEISAFNTQTFRGLQPGREKAAEEKKQRVQAEAAEKAAREAEEKAAREAAAAELAEKKATEKAAREAAVAELAQKKAAEKAAREAAAAELAQKKAAEKAARAAAAAELAQKKAAEKAARKAAVAEQAEKKAAEKAAKKAAAAELSQKKAEEKAARKAAAKQKPRNPRKLVVPAVCAAAVCVSALVYVSMPMIKYSRAESLMDKGRYEEAIAAFEALEGYKDSLRQIENCREGIRENAYCQAVALKEQGDYVEAYYAFEKLGRDYKDCADQIEDCKDASEEVTYLAAKGLMEQRFFPAAKITLQKIEHYKDSQSLLQICNEEIGLSKKEEALELIASIRPQEYSDATKYIKAVELFLEAESLGVDCDAEIRQYEISMLDHPLLKKHHKLNLYVTRGEPVGRETKLYPAAKGGVYVYSMTRVDLDNGCMRFTIDCIPKEGVVGFNVFNPPGGTVFAFHGTVNPVSERQTFVFDIMKEDVRKAGDMTIGFGDISPKGKGGWIYVRNLY